MDTSARLRVVVADPVPAARASLSRIVEGPWGWQVVGDAADGFAAVRLTRTTAADVLLVDASIGGLDLRDIRELLASSQAVVVGMLERPEQHAAQSGPSALKSVPVDALRARVIAALDERWQADEVGA